MSVVARRRSRSAVPAPLSTPAFLALSPAEKFAVFRSTYPKAAASMLKMMGLIWESGTTQRRRAATAARRGRGT